MVPVVPITGMVTGVVVITGILNSHLPGEAMGVMGGYSYPR